MEEQSDEPPRAYLYTQGVWSVVEDPQPDLDAREPEDEQTLYFPLLSIGASTSYRSGLACVICRITCPGVGT